jgi:hypothetical protein
MNSTAIVVIGLIVIAVFALLSAMRTMQSLPSPEALAILTANALTTIIPYPKNMTSRKSLYDYLQSIGTQPNSQMALCNFYVMTANLAGILPPIKGAAVSSTAIQYALQAGARGLIFDIWADDNDFPILQVGVGDDSIHKLSPYNLDLLSALQMVQKEAFANSANPANNDPLFLVFRFRGPKPSNAFYTNLANVLSQALEKHRLPLVFTKADSSNTLVHQPITEYYGKMIVISDHIAPVGNRWNEYINNPIVPTTPIGPISIPGEIRSLSKDNITTVQTTTSQKHILVCAPKPEDILNSETNSWDWKDAHAAGIQLVAMNLWSNDDNLKSYLDKATFGTYSWLIKPLPLRYTVEYIPPPVPVSNPGYGNGNVVVN